MSDLSRSLISFFLFLSLSFTLSFQSISESPSGWAFLISFLSFLLSLQERSAAVCVCVTTFGRCFQECSTLQIYGFVNHREVWDIAFAFIFDHLLR
uniref:Secreted protein n=1 Tax=Physcomitrium patens TaxID=3218 RepID=A0A2K1L6T8_PHYPA|nr:hypothetical protein PHYPA_000134 [Physcomitrium patens]